MNNLKKIENLNQVAQILQNINNIYIVTHSFPDGDALGSAFVLCRALQKINKTCKVLLGSKLSKKYEFFNNYINIPKKFRPNYVISVDLATDSLLDNTLQRYTSRIDLCIDHHISNTNYASMSYVDPNAAANCEIIYDLINILEIPLDKQMAEGLYLGISTDTGCFRYSNTTSKTHYISSELMKLDINTSELNERFFTLKSKKILEIEKILYNNIKYYCQDKIAISYVTYKNIKDQGLSEHDCDGIASIPIRIEGVQIGIVVRERENGEYKVSVRTSEHVNANNIAMLFNGGGHYKASGFNISEKISIPDLLNIIIIKIIKFLGW